MNLKVLSKPHPCFFSFRYFRFSTISMHTIGYLTFLQVTIRQGREIYETVEMSELPSCIIDLVQKRSSSSDSTGRMAALDLSKLSVSLDLVTITLPREMTLPLKLESSRRSVSLGSSLSLPEAETSVFFESIIRDDVESSEEKLPPIQVLSLFLFPTQLRLNAFFGYMKENNKSPFITNFYSQAEAVNSLIKALKWMLDDEIAFALTQANPITQTVLSKVGILCQTMMMLPFFDKSNNIINFDLYRLLPTLIPRKTSLDASCNKYLFNLFSEPIEALQYLWNFFRTCLSLDIF